ncbi:MAG: 6-hydroxycyclohex-1-ene-1-carbonyl-CoA dehydrogenase [Planctomycetota bacterium]
MKALRFESVKAPLTLHDVPRPTPGPDEVLVKVAGCGVCHTDISFWLEGVPTRKALPLTLGHEISGVVVEAGPQAGEWKGREVIVPAVIPCGHCALCRGGRSNVCRSQIMPGNDIDGGFAEFVCVPSRGLCHITNKGSLKLEDLSVVADAVTTPYQAVVRSGLRQGDMAIVVGLGGVGGYCAQIASALGAKVVGLDVSESRLQNMTSHGVSLPLNPSKLDFKGLKAQIQKSASLWGCPPDGWKIFECSGNIKGQETALGLVGPASTLLVVGFTLEKVNFRLSNLMAFDATIQGTWGCRPELYGEALSLVTSGRVSVAPFIRHEPLSRGPELLEAVGAHKVSERVVLIPD